MKKALSHHVLPDVLTSVSPRFTEAIAAIAAQEWCSYVKPLEVIGDNLIGQIPNPQDPQMRRELYRGIFAQLSNAYFGLLCADPQHPDFWPYLSSANTFAAMNPDDDYYTSPIDDTGVYKLSGFRGTVKRIDFQIGNGTFFPRGEMDKTILGHTLANYDLDSIEHDKDGAFEVILSPERPAGYEGHWWQLTASTTYLLVRQICYDWVNEVCGRLAIERLDRAAIKPRASAATLEENLLQIAKWTEETVQLSLGFAKGIRLQQGVNKLAYKDLAEYGEITGQKYAYGGFDLAPDEALVLEMKIPEKSRYWSIHLMDDHGFTMDWVHHQTILNGHTAQVDEDGFCRVVISAQDPGVPNWLDTAGYRYGCIQVRWELCSHWPEHPVTLVKVKDIRRHLPASTPVVSAEQRDATIRLRRKGAQLRKRW